MRVAPVAPFWRRPQAWAAALLALLLFALGWAIAGQSYPATVAAAPGNSVSADAHAALQLEREQLTAKVEQCRGLALTLRSATLKQQTQWQRHRAAHKLFMSGKINQEERNRRWQLTIAAGDALEPLLSQAAEQWRLHCSKP